MSMGQPKIEVFSEKDLNTHKAVEEIQKIDRNILVESVITDPNKITNLIEWLQNQQNVPGANKEVIKSRLAQLDAVLQMQIDLTVYIFGAKVKDEPSIIPNVSEQQLNFNNTEQIQNSSTPEIKEQIENGNLINAKDRFKQAAAEETNKENNLAIISKEQVFEDDKQKTIISTIDIEQKLKSFLGYKRIKVIDTNEIKSINHGIGKKINNLFLNAKTESEVDTASKLLINEGFIEMALNANVDVFTARLGNPELPIKTQVEVESRFLNETMPWSREVPVLGMRDINERDLAGWSDYIEDIYEVYNKREKIITDAVSDLEKQKFISIEVGDPIRSLMFETVIYDEIMGAIALKSNIKLEDIKFEEYNLNPCLTDNSFEVLEKFHNKAIIQDAEIIEDIKKEEIVTAAEEAAIEGKTVIEDSSIKTSDDIKTGIIEIIKKGLSDTKININNVVGTFYKQMGGKKIMKGIQDWNLDKFIKNTKKELAPVLTQEKIEETNNIIAEVEKLEDKPADVILDQPKEIVDTTVKKKPFFKYMMIGDIEKLDPSIIEEVKKHKDLNSLTSFLQQVAYDIPKIKDSKIDKGTAYNVAANLANVFIKNIDECKDWNDDKIHDYFKNDIIIEGRKVRPDVKKELSNKDVHVTFDNTTKSLEERKTDVPLEEVKDTEKKEIVSESIAQTETISSVSTVDNIKTFNDLPEDIKLKFGTILSSSKKEFQTLSEDFLLHKDYKTLDERKDILANIIWKEAPARKGARENERINGVNKLVQNSPRIQEFIKAQIA